MLLSIIFIWLSIAVYFIISSMNTIDDTINNRNIVIMSLMWPIPILAVLLLAVVFFITNYKLSKRDTIGG